MQTENVESGAIDTGFRLTTVEDYESLIGAGNVARILDNAARMHLDHDLVIVHDPQPLPLIRHFRKKAPWVWRCHGAVEAFRLARREFDATLVLVGNVATDDPEGRQVFESLCGCSEDIIGAFEPSFRLRGDMERDST